MSITRRVCVTALVCLALDGVARADAIQLFESTQGAGVYTYTYDTLSDLVTGDYNQENPPLYKSDIWKVKGLAYDGSQYIQLFESTQGAGVYTYTYNTFADLVAGDYGREYAPLYKSDIWKVMGLAHDGNQYIQLFESTQGAGVYTYTYDTLADLVAGAYSREYAPLYKSDIWKVKGLAHDGSQYIQLFESTQGAGVYTYTYDTLADLVAGAYSREYAPLYKSDIWKVKGLAFDEKGPPDQPPIPEPSTWVLVGLSGVSLLWLRRRRKASCPF